MTSTTTLTSSRATAEAAHSPRHILHRTAGHGHGGINARDVDGLVSNAVTAAANAIRRPEGSLSR